MSMFDQILCLDHEQTLTLEPAEIYSASYIPTTSMAIDANGLRGALSERAADEGYHSAEDLFLIWSFPDEEEGCWEYYLHDGPDLAGLHTPHWLRRADYTMASSIRPLLDRMIGKNKSVVAFYAGVIYGGYKVPRRLT
jgi:hypothetical protein